MNPTPDVLELWAPAKVNLFLRVLAREEGGYHQVETLFQQVELSDRLQVERTDGAGVDLVVEGAELGPARENLAWRAAVLALEAAGARGGVRIRLEKQIPPGAGLGGGSSDGAAVLTGVNRLLGGPLSPARLLELASALGSDVPAFLSPSPTTLAWGRGGRLLPLHPLPPRPVLLALPPFPVSTPEAYRRLAADRAGAPPCGASLLDLVELSSWDGVERLAVNDFEAPVFAWHPLLGKLREGLARAGAAPALLSGSGSTVFGVFEDPERASDAAVELAASFPEVRWLLSRTRWTGER